MERDNNTAHKLSRYNYRFPFDGGFALWNSFSGALLKLNEREWAALESGLVPELSPEREKEWMEKGVLIPNGFDELRRLEEDVQCAQLLYFRILTTTACNANCAYCYEKNTPLCSMDDKTAEQTARFIIDRYRSAREIFPVCLEWFGGEPTLNAAPISQICKRLRQEEVSFRSSMTTNGLLLDELISEKTVKLWNLRTVQISLDGDADAHERAKNFRPGSFARIIRNVRLLLACGVSVKLRINHGDNAPAVRSLISFLAEEFAGEKEKLWVYVSPLYQKDREYTREQVEEIVGLNSLLLDRGLARVESLYALPRLHSRCVAARPGGAAIAPDGRLYNCSHNMSERQCTGSVWQADENHPCRAEFTAPGFSQRCRECFLLPVCAGGCRCGELGLADIGQCHPYKNGIDLILSERLRRGEFTEL